MKEGSGCGPVALGLFACGTSVVGLLPLIGSSLSVIGLVAGIIALGLSVPNPNASPRKRANSAGLGLGGAALLLALAGLRLHSMSGYDHWPFG